MLGLFHDSYSWVGSHYFLEYCSLFLLPNSIVDSFLVLGKNGTNCCPLSPNLSRDAINKLYCIEDEKALTERRAVRKMKLFMVSRRTHSKSCDLPFPSFTKTTSQTAVLRHILLSQLLYHSSGDDSVTYVNSIEISTTQEDIKISYEDYTWGCAGWRGHCFPCRLEPMVPWGGCGDASVFTSWLEGSNIAGYFNWPRAVSVYYHLLLV